MRLLLLRISFIQVTCRDTCFENVRTDKGPTHYRQLDCDIHAIEWFYLLLPRGHFLEDTMCLFLPQCNWCGDAVTGLLPGFSPRVAFGVAQLHSFFQTHALVLHVVAYTCWLLGSLWNRPSQAPSQTGWPAPGWTVPSQVLFTCLWLWKLLLTLSVTTPRCLLSSLILFMYFSLHCLEHATKRILSSHCKGLEQ